MNLIEKIKLIERVDGLIRRKSTGSPKQLASRLNMSERTLYNVITVMKKMGAPIYFCRSRGSFCYEEEVEFVIGFTTKSQELKKITGGIDIFFMKNNPTAKNLQLDVLNLV